MWAYLTNGAEPDQIREIERALDGEIEDPPRGGRNVSALLAGMKGG